MKNLRWWGHLALALLLVAAVGRTEEKPHHQGLKAELLVELPEGCNTPDGMTQMPDGSIMLSVPNFNDKSSPAVLVRIGKDRKAEVVCKLPPHPDTGRAGPMGLAATAEGDIYLADNQWFEDTDHKSRLLKVVMDDAGKPKEFRTIVSGLRVANAVLLAGDYIYVSDTILSDPENRPLISGVFRFGKDETNVELRQPLLQDPHLIGTIKTHNPAIPFGADGLAMDSRGNLYLGNFADGTVHKLSMAADGRPTGPFVVFARDPKMRSADGMFYDKNRDQLLVADSIANAVQIVKMDGTVETLSQYPNSTGANGELDQPCEVLLWGNEVVVANMDFPVPGGVNTTFEPPFTLSTIKLPQ